MEGSKIRKDPRVMVSIFIVNASNAAWWPTPGPLSEMLFHPLKGPGIVVEEKNVRW